MRCKVLIRGHLTYARLISIQSGHAQVLPDGSTEIEDVLTYQIGRAWDEELEDE